MKKTIALILCLCSVSSILTSCASDNVVEPTSSSIGSHSSTQELLSSTSQDVLPESTFLNMQEEQSEIIDQYMAPFGVTGLFHYQFSSEDLSNIDGPLLITMFQALHYQNGEGYPTVLNSDSLDLEVEASVIEEGILSWHFNLTPEEIKEKCSQYYQESTNTYTIPEGLGGGPQEFLITSFERNEGILTFSYEIYGAADEQTGSDFLYQKYRTGTMEIDENGETYIFLSNTSKEI